MLSAIKEYLEADIPIFLEFMPDQGPAMGLFCWSHTPEAPYDGCSLRLLQVQVRHADPEAAYTACMGAAKALESGADECPLPINWPGAVIGNVRRLPTLLDRSETYFTYYCEAALYGAARKDD